MSSRLCIALSFDSAMFAQAQACIASIRRHCRYAADLRVLALGLSDDERAWLAAQGVGVSDDVQRIPTYPDAPTYAWAMTCRPYLRELFPGYDVYMYVDADVRFEAGDAFDFYVQGALASPASIVIAQEVDSTYTFIRDPQVARIYHMQRIQRMAAAFGRETAERLGFIICYNAGVFAMHASSPVWARYRAHLERALASGFDHMKEQDAMNLAVLDGEVPPVVAPPTMNWLCSIAIPQRCEASGRWVRPTLPRTPISVLHLTQSSAPVNFGGRRVTMYEAYRALQLTA